ncbi:FadR family transcriptional regulator [Curvibacter sp. CHRR-16]|uniref:FadR/GntR family transcriptional regulator n=1 Tax=Curvibacter sp. CHRR-16 TaxID=2835872 RepID=UPI001BDB166F|nr:FadR/GntR family transcriptional regulator [Curvibacter sp. CHRR-16]MBT0570573.1 FadR family transcriptional regulator [Curvibacter sp. CHRR-16]
MSQTPPSPSNPTAHNAHNHHSTYSGSTLHGQVVHELGRRVVGGSYAAGALLPNEDQLCSELAVSRTALREAVKVLAAKGLLEPRPRIGTRVRAQALWNLLDPDILAWRCSTGVDAAFVLHLLQVRVIIEPPAASLAAQSHTPEQLHTMQEALQKMEQAQHIQQWVEADLAFHTSILQATNNPLLMPLAAIIGSALESLLHLSARNSDNFNQALPDHQKLLAAIAQRDSQAALHRMASLLADTSHLLQPFTHNGTSV